MINFEDELSRIFGDKYEGCTQRDDELIEYRLKAGKIATLAELSKVAALPKDIRTEIDDLRTRLTQKGILTANG